MPASLFPRVADNRFPGRPLGLWLFGLMPLKLPMGANLLLDTAKVAEQADGVPISRFDPAGAQAFLLAFAAWGLCQRVLGLGAVVVLWRYRSLVPLAWVALQVEPAVECCCAPRGQSNVPPPRPARPSTWHCWPSW